MEAHNLHSILKKNPSQELSCNALHLMGRRSVPLELQLDIQ